MNLDAVKLKIKPEDLVMVVSVVVIALVAYFVAIPQTEKLKAKAAELAQKQTQHDALEQKRDMLADLTERLDQYEADIARLDVAYPKEEQAVEAMIQTRQIAERAGMAVVSLAPSKGNNGNLAVSMSIKGSYEGLVKFLYELDNNLRPVIVHAINITPASEKDAGLLSVNVAASFAYNGSAAAVTSSTTPAGTTAPAGDAATTGATGALSAPAAQ